MTDYSLSYDSNTIYIATVNIRDLVYGEWRLDIQSQGSYSVLIKEFSGLIVSTDILAIRSDDNYYNEDVVDTKPLESKA